MILRRLHRFLAYLMGPLRQTDQRVSARTFRRHNEALWTYWPTAPVVDEIHRVVLLDGLYLQHCGVLLVVSTPGGQVLGWFIARCEHTEGYEAL